MSLVQTNCDANVYVHNEGCHIPYMIAAIEQQTTIKSDVSLATTVTFNYISRTHPIHC